MPGFEEEAFRRAQQISRPRSHKERVEAVREPEKPKPKPEVKEEQKAELPNINNSEKEIKSNPKPEKTGLIETLFKDKEKSVILALILLLSDENSDPSLLLALMYLLI